MGKKKKASEHVVPVEDPIAIGETEIQPDLTSELIEEEKAVESVEPVIEEKEKGSDYENHPKFQKFRGEK